MAIQNALTFLQEIDTNKDLRSSLYACKSKSGLNECLNKFDMLFTYNEFEDAFNLQHVKCQTQEAANELFEKANMFKFLFYSLPNQ